MKRTALIAWAAFGLITLISIWAALLDTAVTRQGGPPQPWFGYLVGPVFALVGALILARQPDNSVGWLMLLPGASASVLVDAYFRSLNNGLAPLPPTLTPGLWLALWYSNWNWTLLILSLALVDAPVSHWTAAQPPLGWLVWVGVGLLLFLLLLATFVTPMQPAGGGSADWSYPNPISLIQYSEVSGVRLCTFLGHVNKRIEKEPRSPEIR